MEIYHLEANGRTNTGEYVNTLCEGISEITQNDVGVFTSLKSLHIKPITFFKNYGSSNRYLKLFYYVSGWCKICNFLLKKNVKVVFHVHWLRFSLLDLFFIKLLKLNSNIKLVATVHNNLPHEAFVFDKIMFSRIYSLFDSLIFHSNQNILDFKELFPNNEIDKIVIPHYSYDVYPYVPPVDLTVKVLFFGAIRPYKGLELLLKSLSCINDDFKFELVVAGKPEYDISGLIKMIDEDDNMRNRVIWKLGWIKDGDIPDLFKNSHIVVLPYIKIDNSGLLHLAMSYGKTVVVPDIGLFKDLIINDLNGYVFQCNNVESLKDVLIELFNKRQFDRIGAKAILSMESHSISKIAFSIVEIYKKL